MSICPKIENHKYANTCGLDEVLISDKLTRTIPFYHEEIETSVSHRPPNTSYHQKHHRDTSFAE